MRLMLPLALLCALLAACGGGGSGGGTTTGGVTPTVDDNPDGNIYKVITNNSDIDFILIKQVSGSAYMIYNDDGTSVSVTKSGSTYTTTGASITLSADEKSFTGTIDDNGTPATLAGTVIAINGTPSTTVNANGKTYNLTISDGTTATQTILQTGSAWIDTDTPPTQGQIWGTTVVGRWEDSDERHGMYGTIAADGNSLSGTTVVFALTGGSTWSNITTVTWTGTVAGGGSSSSSGGSSSSNGASVIDSVTHAWSGSATVSAGAVTSVTGVRPQQAGLFDTGLRLAQAQTSTFAAGTITFTMDLRAYTTGFVSGSYSDSASNTGEVVGEVNLTTGALNLTITCLSGVITFTGTVTDAATDTFLGSVSIVSGSETFTGTASGTATGGSAQVHGLEFQLIETSDDDFDMIITRPGGEVDEIHYFSTDYLQDSVGTPNMPDIAFFTSPTTGTYTIKVHCYTNSNVGVAKTVRLEVWRNGALVDTLFNSTVDGNIVGDGSNGTPSPSAVAATLTYTYTP